jgi:hypothetical protein
MAELNIQEIINSLTVINEKRKYWFIRTQGGKYYDEFVLNKYVAIGYNEIQISDLAKSNTGNNVGKDILAEVIRKIYPDEKRPNYIGTQLLDFAYNIKKGDVIIIPSNSSDRVSIGEVAETPIFQANIENINDKQCPFEKRKKINWVKIDLPYDSLDPQLLYLKYIHRSITMIDEYTAGFIDRMITPIFIKEKDAHLSIDIRQVEPIKAYDLFETWISLFQLTEEIGKEEGLDVKKEDFDTKINVQSPGTIEFISYSITGIVILSTLVAALIGADVDVKSKLINFKIKSEGLIKVITNYLNNKTDRKLRETIIDKINKMDIDPKELVKILQQVSNKKN